jgi:transposase InsO family protein
MCRLANVCRSTFYRWLKRAAAQDHNMEVRSQIQTICIEHRHYGYRRVQRELSARGLRVNHKRILRLMRDDNLLAVRKRKFVTTTDSRHPLPVFTNYAAQLRPDGPDRLWVADVTYIRLRSEFVYLAVVLDVFSRKVVGWELARHLQAKLCRTALERAIADRRPPIGLVHHSDRGVQYASAEYLEVLGRHGMVGSMSRGGNPRDNAFCESFIKTLKKEEIYCRQYADLDDLSLHVAAFIDHYYNRKRMHSSLGYLSPEAFESAQRVAVA